MTVFVGMGYPGAGVWEGGCYIIKREEWLDGCFCLTSRRPVGGHRTSLTYLPAWWDDEAFVHGDGRDGQGVPARETRYMGARLKEEKRLRTGVFSGSPDQIPCVTWGCGRAGPEGGDGTPR